MVTLQQIKDNLQDITSQQIGKCQKVIDLQTNEDFYICESSDGTDDYEVRYSLDHGFTCTCKAGQHGFYNCKTACWHVRASVACWLEEEAAKQEMIEKIEAEKKSRSIESQVPAWILNARPASHMRRAPREY